MYLFAFVAIDIVMAIVIYFMSYYLGRGGETENVLGVLLAFQVLALPVFVKISQRTDKRTAYMMASIYMIAVMLLGILITPGMPNFAVYLFAALVGFGSGGIIIMIYAIFPDIPDIDELYTGERREGLYSGIITFSRKVSSAVAIAAISIAISLAGYQAPVEESIDGIAKLVQQPQSIEFLWTLRILLVGLPALFFALCLVSAIRLSLTKRTHADLKKILEKKRAGLASETLSIQAESLKRSLEKRSSI